jgi:hypothetical protein
MMCITCVHVKHNKGPTCLLGKLKLPLSVEEDYQCLDCVCTQDGLLHVNDCSKCNAIPNLFGTIRRLLEFISTTDHEFKGEPGRWWLARLDRIESDVNTRLLPHLVQDAQQEEAKSEAVKGLKFHQSLIVKDWGAKMKEKQGHMPQVCVHSGTPHLQQV